MKCEDIQLSSLDSWLWLVDSMEKSPRHWVLFHRPDAKMGEKYTFIVCMFQES